MKKTILKSTLSLFSIAILFSSCLGDNTSSMERTRDFTVIKTLDGPIPSKYAATSIGYQITSPEIDKLTTGNAYYLSYKITEFTANNAGLYNAEVREQVFINKAMYYNSSLPAPSEPKDSVSVSSFGIGAFSGDDYYDDRWLFGYAASVKEGETVKVSLYYDKDKQQEKDKPIITTGDERENKLIIDVHFTKENPNSTSETTTTTSEEVFADLSRIRQEFTPNPLIKEDIVQSNGKEYIKVKFKFRFWRSSNNTKEQVYLGTWSVNEASTTGYLMYMEKK